VVLVHGGLANRGFWRHQLERLSVTHQVVAIDLAGHGQSGRDRRNWDIAQFAADVRAVADHLALTRLVIVGNSLGGPVALEAAVLLPGRAIGVVGIDTFHNATAQQDPAEVIARASAFEADPLGSCQSMVQQLFHPQGHAELRAWAEAEMCKVPSRVVGPMLRAFAGYNLAAAMRAAGVPIRAINGDLWPTIVDVNRTVVPDFEAIIMPRTGHYPMLERPETFNSTLEELVGQLDKDWSSRPR
jgi:pimeloyl-ACP methyl ester carboxylesterase